MENNMDASKEYSKELIQVFLDGETTEIENTVLFQALAASSALQQEFQSALRFGTAMQAMAKPLQPPADLEALVMKTVGFDTPVAPVHQSNNTSIKSAALIFLGALLMYGIMKITPTSTAPTSESSAQFPAIQAAGREVVSTENYHHAAATQINTMSKLNSENRITGSVDARKITTSYQEAVRSTESAADENPSQAELFEQSNSTTAPSITSTPFQTIPHIADNRFSIPTDKKQAVISSEIQSIAAPTESPWLPKYAVFRGKLGAFRSANTMGANVLTIVPDVSAGDVQASAAWSISANSSLGIEAGRERLPLYEVQTLDGVNTYTLNDNITWVAVQYRLDGRPEVLDFLCTNDTWFTSGLSAGFSTIGPLLRGEVSYNYTVYNSWYISAGPEITSQFFRKNGSVQAAVRIGVGIGIGYTFQ